MPLLVDFAFFVKVRFFRVKWIIARMSMAARSGKTTPREHGLREEARQVLNMKKSCKTTERGPLQILTAKSCFSCFLALRLLCFCLFFQKLPPLLIDFSVASMRVLDAPEKVNALVPGVSGRVASMRENVSDRVSLFLI